MDRNDTLNALPVPHPGEFIREELEARDWTQRDLAFVLGVPEQAVNMIVTGKRGISPDMAKALGIAFDVPAEFFSNLQNAYDLSKARTPDPSIERRAMLQNTYPIREMIKRGWLESSDASMLEAQLVRFFCVESFSEIPHFAHAGKKRRYDEMPPEQLAWLFRVKQIARGMVVDTYSEGKLRTALADLRRLTVAPEEARHVAKILAACGVRFVIVEALPRSEIDGVCFWLDKKSPVVGMSLRRDWMDNFWFVLRHEIEHVLQKHGQEEEIIDAKLEGQRASPISQEIDEQERVANAASLDFCVSQSELKDFIARVEPLFSEQKVTMFARRLGVHPALVVGQLQHRLDDYAFLRRLIPKIRAHVVPSALADGWGAVVPTSL